MNKFENFRGHSHGRGDPPMIVSFSVGAQQGSHSEYWGKIPSSVLQKKGEKSLFLKKVLREILFIYL